MSIFAQQIEKQYDFKKNEIHLNLLNATAFGLLDATYQYNLEDNMSLGVSISKSLLKDEDNPYRHIIIPNYRLYFGRKPASGFYIEGNVAIMDLSHNVYSPQPLTSQNTSREKPLVSRDIDPYYSQSGDYRIVQTTNFGMGMAVGVKFLTRNNFVGDIFGGLGRIFGDTYNENFYPRLGISLGKRF